MGDISLACLEAWFRGSWAALLQQLHGITRMPVLHSAGHYKDPWLCPNAQALGGGMHTAPQQAMHMLMAMHN